MNKGLYAFLKEDEIFVVVCKSECLNEWENLRQIDGWEVEADDKFYIMGTDARAELKNTTSEKLLEFKSNDATFFKCPISTEFEEYLIKKGAIGFFLIQSEDLVDEEQAFQMFSDGEIEGLICAFYTKEKKIEFFELDENGNISGLK